MRLMMDAHTLIWAVDKPSSLSPPAATALQDPSNQLLLGAGTVWEIGIKVGLKKLSLSQPFHAWMTQAIRDLGLTILAITLDHVDAQVALPGHHKDPFDRLMIAQALVEQVPLVSADGILDQYPVTRLW